MTLALGLSYPTSRAFKNFWLRLAFFVLIAAFAFFFYVSLCGFAAALWTDGDSAYRAATLQNLWSALGGIVAMDYFGIWRLKPIIDAQRSKRADQG